MMGKNYSEESRQVVADKIMEWGNLVFIGLVITQLIPGPLSEPGWIFFGFGILALAYAVGLRLLKGGEK